MPEASAGEKGRKSPAAAVVWGHSSYAALEVLRDRFEACFPRVPD